MNSEGFFDTAANVARTEIAPRLANAPDKPFVLLACEAGSSGAAQEVANVLRRPVIAFQQRIAVGPPDLLKLSAPFPTAQGVSTPFALQKIPHLKGLTGVQGPKWYALGLEYEFADFTVFGPK